MKEETTFDFNMSALRVWSLISDLRGYARWHPIYRIAGDAERGAEPDAVVREEPVAELGDELGGHRRGDRVGPFF